MVFLPTDPRDRQHCEELFETIVRERGPGRPRLAHRADRQLDHRPDRQVRRAGDAAGLHRPAGPRRARPRQRRSGLRAQALRHPQARRERGAQVRADAAGDVLRPEPVVQDAHLQGHAQRRRSSTPYFPDLSDPAMESALALVHSRFSTNTFPTWARAHPYRYICHNGEINTLRGNVNWMHARESLFALRAVRRRTSRRSCPIIDETGSDSAMFDNALELLVLTGRSLPHAVMMMIPEPWSGDTTMSPEKRAFYEYHSCLMEPWDGPASIAFTDGMPHRRRPRPQRPAAVALLRHQGRPGHHGLRGRRARRRRRRTCCTRAGCSRAACSWSTWSRAGSSPTTS